MMKNNDLTRRALLAGAGATLSSAALGVSAFASSSTEATEPEAPTFDLQAWLDTQTPAERANYHQTQLAMAMCDLSPGKWRTAVTVEQDFVLVIRDAKTAPENASVFVQYLYQA